MQVTIYHASARPTSPGHYKILAEVEYKGRYKLFADTTTNMVDYDAAMQLEGKAKSRALYELIERKVSDEVKEWIDSIDNKTKKSNL